jgi:L-ribulokinase
MSDTKFVIGLDFGTESGRAVLVEVSTGLEVASSVYPYQHGVIDEVLPVPGKTIRLEPDWALQDPLDYIRTLQHTIPSLLASSGIDPAGVIGLGVDFTACSMLPVKADGTPLAALPEFQENPHAWVKLWKHHAAQAEADKINATARTLGQKWLERYGNKISSEWFFSKTLQILNEAPEIYQAAGRLIEAADWIVWQLTGEEKRNSCTAGYKAIWSKREGFPSKAYFAALHPRLENVVAEKLSADIYPVGERAGRLTGQAAEWSGLKPGTAVAFPSIDAHAAVPAVTVTEPGRMVLVMGTSTCHMILAEEEHTVPGICGCVEDGIIPGFFGYEAGQACVGDHLAWFIENCVPAGYAHEAAEAGIDLHQLLEEKAARLKPGESGLLALDWWNGNRSVLVDAELSGLLVGATLATRPEEIYRALIEATAYGTRMIIETFQEHGIPVEELVVCGGLPEKNRLLIQIYADVTGRKLKVAASQHTSALGSAMFAAVAAGQQAGGYSSIFEASRRMARLKDETFEPEPENMAVYDLLYVEYCRLHDTFGRGENDLMKTLKRIKAGAIHPSGQAAGD